MEILKIKIRISYEGMGRYRLLIIVFWLVVPVNVMRKFTIKHWFFGKREKFLAH